MITDRKMADIMEAWESANSSTHNHVTTPWVQCHRAIPDLIDEIRRLKNRFILLRDMSYDEVLKMEEARAIEEDAKRSKSMEYRQ